ncbi:RNA 5'-monophosphate methyltransferase [Protopterus annectens]|uniref:RNA 5'-monophosphate methyltransferase n=1 Tax=Protopterus annectens TaxID=7888 RepID=UPI001CF9D481|nr:RNA 5'-monophosphate methyltransferase [Protopterus annectens]
MEQKEYEEISEPGAAPYGNFINYYTFNPPEKRVSLIPEQLLHQLFGGREHERQLLGLDVGCNSGDLTVALYRHLIGLNQNVKNEMGYANGIEMSLLGCDIDSRLIQRATESNPFPAGISYSVLNIMDASSRKSILEAYLSQYKRSHFDVCFCMSLTMWIHLNHGDSGLLEFLSVVSGLCNILLVEPQPWKCYRSAARRLRKLGKSTFDHFKTLAIKGDIADKITHFLTTACDMELLEILGNTCWDRSLLLFRKRISTKPFCVADEQS